MRRSVIGAVVMSVWAVGLAVGLIGCGSSLTSVQANAVQKVEANLAQYGVTGESAPVVVGKIDKDAQGNQVTLVQVTYPQGGKRYDMIIIVVQKANGTLLFADVLLPSSIVTVQ